MKRVVEYYANTCLLLPVESHLVWGISYCQVYIAALDLREDCTNRHSGTLTMICHRPTIPLEGGLSSSKFPPLT